MPVEILAALIAAFIAVLVSALYALRQSVRAAEARMELAQLGQKLKNIGTEVAGTIAQTEAERDAALAILDALPTPVWRRGADHALAYCNRAYAAAVGRDAEAVVDEATELPGKAQASVSRALARRALESGKISSERLHVVVAGERRLMELFETPLSAKESSAPADDGAGETAGMALDRTASEELQSELKRHIEAHAEVLEALGSGIAIFGPDMHLKFFNTAYARLWGLEEEALKGEPHLNDIHELLREQRRLPEQSDFPAYKRDQVRLFSTLIEPLEDLLHLPDGTTLRLTATPHPFGGVLMSFEDVTDRLALESSYNTLIAVQRETLDHLFEGVAVYGADGRLKLFNPVYARLWGLAESFLGGEPHMREVIPETRAYFNTPDDAWPALMERILGKSTEPNPRGRRRERADGSVVEWAQVPLPDGANLFTFLDVTDSTRVERALRVYRRNGLVQARGEALHFSGGWGYQRRFLRKGIHGGLSRNHRDRGGAAADARQGFRSERQTFPLLGGQHGQCFRHIKPPCWNFPGFSGDGGGPPMRPVMRKGPSPRPRRALPALFSPFPAPLWSAGDPGPSRRPDGPWPCRGRRGSCIRRRRGGVSPESRAPVPWPSGYQALPVYC